MLRAFIVAVVSLLVFPATAVSADDPAVAETPVSTGIAVHARPATRGAILPLLYGTLGAAQFYDGWSTVAGLRQGAREANPLMAPFAANTRVLVAVKTGTTLLSIYAAERLWRSHRRAEAIAMMAITNGVMASVAIRNASVIRR